MKPYELSQYMYQTTLPSGAGLMGYKATENYAAGTVGEAIKNLGTGGGGGGGGSGVVTTSYVYNANITVAPAVGEIRFDAAPPNTATYMKVSQTTTDGIDVGLAYSYLAPGQRVYIQDATDATRYLKATVVGTPADMGTWWSFPILVTEASVPSLLQERAIIGWPASAASGSGLAVNVIPKGASAGGLVASQFFDSGVNVGLGTTTPAAKLHVAGGGGIFEGAVSIGTTTPINAELHVAAPDNAASLGLTGVSKGMRFTCDSGGSRIEGVDNTLAATFQPFMLNGSVLNFSTGNVIRMSIDAAGTTRCENSLTIGQVLVLGNNVTTQDCIIEVGGNRTADGSAYIDLHGTAGSDYETRIVRANGTNGDFVIANRGTGIYYLTQASVAPMVFQTQGVERMRIGSGGLVGINRANPVQALDVNGSICVGYNNFICTTYSGPNTDTGSIRAGIQFTGDTPAMYFYTANTQQGYIDAVGNWVINNNLTVRNPIYCQNATMGGCFLSPGDPTHSGYIRFTKVDGSSVGYIGFSPLVAGGSISYVNENAGGHNFTGKDFTITNNVGSNVQVVLANNIANAYGLWNVNNTPDVIFNTGPAIVTMYMNNGTGGVYLPRNGTSWLAISDERQKTIIEPIASAVEKLAGLRTVIGRFKIDDTDQRRSFLIAQDVQKVFPEAVHQREHGTEAEEELGFVPLGLDYAAMVPLLVAAIKELEARIVYLENIKR